jgi:hypothetical protein
VKGGPKCKVIFVAFLNISLFQKKKGSIASIQIYEDVKNI